MKKAALVLVFTLGVALLILTLTFERVDAQFSGSIFINPDGTVTGTSLIQRDGDTYTLTGNLSSGIQIQKSNIILDGAGYAIEGNGEGWGLDLSNGRGQDLTRTEINNVTVKNLKIVNMHFGVNNLNTNDNTFTANYFVNCTAAISIVGSTNNLIVSNTFENSTLAISYSASNTFAKNNFINSSMLVSASMPPALEMNYWSDYTAKYPDAQEIGDLGMWNIPYVINEDTQDNYPLTSPIRGPSEVAPVDNSFPTVPVAAGAIIAVVVAFLFVYRLKRKYKKQ